jgi:hypothetical protein
MLTGFHALCICSCQQLCWHDVFMAQNHNQCQAALEVSWTRDRSSRLQCEVTNVKVGRPPATCMALAAWCLVVK